MTSLAALGGVEVWAAAMKLHWTATAATLVCDVI